MTRMFDVCEKAVGGCDRVCARRRATQAPGAILTTLVAMMLSSGTPAYAGDPALPEVPARLPNPFKQTVSVPVSIAEDLKLVEQVLYGEVNEDKADERRLSALERTVFGASYANANFSSATRATGLKNIANHMDAGRKFYEAQKWKEAKAEFDEVIRLMGVKWKSLVKAEIYYRIGICEYELSNIGKASPPNSGLKVSGSLLRSSQEDLTRAQDYYKSLGQVETALKISKFIDTFKDKAATYFLYGK